MERRASPTGARIAQAGLAALAFVLFLPGVTEPIVENYVGRQIPTAMVARNLERGSGFFSPQLDTGPFPNLFLVEPPIYAQTVVALRRMTGLPLMASGRIVSGFGILFAVWGLFGIALRRSGLIPALCMGIIFLNLPVVLRYGRAFQPDAMMMGLMVGGLRCWDDAEARESRWSRALGVMLVTLGLATKILAAYFLVPMIFVILAPRRRGKVVLALATLLPALGWYAYVAWRLKMGGGSRASADNASIWIRVLSLEAWLRPNTYRLAAKFLVYRCFTPVWAGLAFLGVLLSWPHARRLMTRGRMVTQTKDPGKADRLWKVWTGSAIAMLMVLAGKAHHEYYWLALAPVVAAGAMNGLHQASQILLDRNASPWANLGLVAILSWVLMSPHDPTPPEWASWDRAVATIGHSVPEATLLVAPEAILFLADRKGCRLEVGARSAERAAGEWGGEIEAEDPLSLVEFYRENGARFVCDLWPVGDEPDRLALHDAIRRRYNVVSDRDGVLLAELVAKPSP